MHCNGVLVQVSGKDLEKTSEANFRSTATSSIAKPLTSDMVIFTINSIMFMMMTMMMMSMMMVMMMMMVILAAWPGE